MSDLEKAARMALEALGYYEVAGLATTRVAKSITALRQALSNSVEQPAQQQEWRGPVDWEEVAADYAMTIAMMKADRKPWVGLTEKEKREARNSVSYSPLAMTISEWTEAVQDATEAKLKEKNA